MSDLSGNKSALRQMLRARLDGMSPEARHAESLAACQLLASTREWQQAHCVMLYLSTPEEIDTAPLALRAWQSGKTVAVPRVSWDQRRMLPTEITSLTNGITSTARGIREPEAGKPIPVDLIDLAIVPGLGFSPAGYRIGRGMGFYDRFLAQHDFIGLACGLAFEEQIVDHIPVLDHDIPLGMLVTNRQIKRFASSCIVK
jgi:5-formyltetrahydrofolate cyclo-ligase